MIDVISIYNCGCAYLSDYGKSRSKPSRQVKHAFAKSYNPLADLDALSVDTPSTNRQMGYGPMLNIILAFIQPGGMANLRYVADLWRTNLYMSFVAMMHECSSVE